MQLKKKPVTGMKDILPQEMEIRDYVIGLIKDTYKQFGFTSMEAPCVEHIENLTSKQGGDNEKLIFRILKRGDKLKIDEAKEENDLVDSGLRYDLTVPLCRFYSNNANELPQPFKALHIGNVFRADRPQRGRFRQFMQCDIDILGDPTFLAEIDVILATSTLVGKLFDKFTIRINDRRILKGMAAYSGFPEDSYNQVFIILDKMDKIGIDGVAAELIESGFDKDGVEKYMDLFKTMGTGVDGVKYCKEKLGGFMDAQVADDMVTIIESVMQAKTANFTLEFDPTLVRGMSYYTGPIFEISIDGFAGSAGGGGRYDEMIGKFTGTPTPATGFSLGFERLVMLLMESGFKVPGASEKKVYLLDKKVGSDKILEVMAKAAEERNEGKVVNIVYAKKNKKFQKEQLENEGYTTIEEIFND